MLDDNVPPAADQPDSWAVGQPPCYFFYSQASSEDFSHFLQEQTNEIYRFISELMDIFCAVGTVEQTEQPNYLAEG
eukprot:1148097-Pelagomonas_calceolata.AAC.1